MTSRNKYELATAIDTILNSSSEVVDTVEKGHQLRRKISQKLAFELDEYINLQIIPSVTGSILNVTNNFINTRIASSFPIDPVAHVPGLRTLGYTGNSAMPGNAAAGGDLSGNYPNPRVTGLYGYPVGSTAPVTDDVLTWNGTAWNPAAGGGGAAGVAGGDLSGSYPNPEVVAIQSNPIAATAPALNEVLSWDGSQWAPSPIPLNSSLLFELDTTVTTDISATTELIGKVGVGGTTPAGTLTPTANVSSLFMPSLKVLEFNHSADAYGLHIRRVLAGTLPAEGWILDIGVANLDTLFTSRGVIMFAYEQLTGTTGRGLGLEMTDGSGTISLMGIGDDGTGAPFTPVNVDSGVITYALSDWTRGPVRFIITFRKLNGQTPAQWMMHFNISWNNPLENLYSGVKNPKTSFSTQVEMDGWAPDRIGLGLWQQHNSTPEDAKISFSHLRVYTLDGDGTFGGPASGDLSGSYPAPTVVGLQTRPVLSTAPATNDILAWNGSAWAPSGTQPGLLFDLDTTVTTDISSTTEGGARSEYGNGPTGTLTVTANEDHPAMPSVNCIKLQSAGPIDGILVRRVLTGTLPTEGWILEVDIANLTVDTGGEGAIYGVIMLGYKQESGAAPAPMTGFFIHFRLTASNTDLNAVGDNAGNCDPAGIGIGGSGEAYSLGIFQSAVGARRLVIEFRKLDAQTPAQWSIKYTIYSSNADVTQTSYSGVANPSSGWTPVLTTANKTFDRVGLGLRGYGTHNGALFINKFRIWSLDSGKT